MGCEHFHLLMELYQMFGDPFQALSLLQVTGKEVCNDSDLGWLQADSRRVTRTRWIDAETVGWARPGKQSTCLILLSPSPSHPLSNQASFILGNRSTDLEQELIVRILAHGPIDKLDLAPSLFKFLHQEHLMNVVAS